MKYRVTIGGATIDVEVQGTRVTVQGVEHEAELVVIAGTPLRLLMLDGESIVLPMEPATGPLWVMQDQGDQIEAEVVDERTAHIQSLVAGGQARSALPALKAPMPGLVIRVHVEPGQEVAAGASLIVLEAMKMENELKAKVAGVIDSIGVVAGQVVEKGELLLTFRP